MASKRDTFLSSKIKAFLYLPFAFLHVFTTKGVSPTLSLGWGKEDGCILIISGTAFDAWRAALAYKMEGTYGESKDHSTDPGNILPFSPDLCGGSSVDRSSFRDYL